MRRVREAELLRESLAELARARGHLEYSFRAVARFDDALENVTEEDLEAIEAFTSRFSRLVDLVVAHAIRRSSAPNAYAFPPGGFRTGAVIEDRRFL